MPGRAAEETPRRGGGAYGSASGGPVPREGREDQTPEAAEAPGAAGQEEIANMSRRLAAAAAARQAPADSPNHRHRWFNRRLPGAGGPARSTPSHHP
ncbi:hypothetical protein GCM10018791_41610 [Streptomyces zaomyceticus]|nr:hypothetical protein GCM10018791_41610 [Streptomyces zaomyceticus]